MRFVKRQKKILISSRVTVRLRYFLIDASQSAPIAAVFRFNTFGFIMIIYYQFLMPSNLSDFIENIYQTLFRRYKLS